jgi:hypothetical protein
MLAANLPTSPSVELGSTLAYALASMRNYVQMSVFEGATDDQIYDVVVDGIDRARQARLDRPPAPPVALEAAG